MEQSYRYVLFDLDGTLTESAPGITASAAYALRQYGIEAEEKDLLRFIGPPITESFMEFYGFSPEQADEAVNRYYRPHYRQEGIFRYALYDGVPEMLAALHAAGKQVLLATSKPEPFARIVLDHAGLTQYFAGVHGSSFDGTHENKAEVIACALRDAGVADKAEAIMVGDRRYDIEGAHACGLSAIGAVYGYGSEAELAAAGAKYLAATPLAVCDILLGADRAPGR